MEKAFVFLATGFEEMEAIGTVDVLRRAGIDAATVSITGNKAVAGAHNITVQEYREGRIVAAICAAPLVLGGLGLLKGRRATCYPSFEEYLIGATTAGANVEVDGNVITGKGPGLVFDFGLALAEAIKGKAVAEEVAGGMLL